MVGGGGERSTLRLVARYADACNVFGGPHMLRHKFDVLEAHCVDVGRDYAEIEKTVIFRFDVSADGSVTQLVDQLGALAELGIQTAIGAVKDVWAITPLEVMGREVIPAVAAL